MKDNNLFGKHFRGSTWDAWRVFLCALFALPMTPEQLATFRQHTGRSAPSLLLPLAQEIGTAQVIGDLGEHVTPPARPRATSVCFDEQRLAVRHPAALLARTTLDHSSICGRIWLVLRPLRGSKRARFRR
jgi:hypothetical protein